MLLQQQGIETVFLEVIRDNHAAVALYQSLGFTRRYGLCGYLSTELLPPVPGVLQLYPGRTDPPRGAFGLRQRMDCPAPFS